MNGQMSFLDFLDPEEAARHRPLPATDWKWSFKDYPKEKNGLKVFSCFACGGGSTMGYKLAGCDVLGCCEIDPKMNEVYVRNHHPKYNYLMDIRDFNALEDLPSDLYDLDILDGSPPCTTFSMAGDREESWGKKKKFREGQKEQTLDDLSFVFIETVKKLKPKTVIMENVEGLLLGEAWSYVQRIYKELDDAGYNVNHWLVKGECIGIPQKRHRVFFVAIRKDIDFDMSRIDMQFNYETVPYKVIKDGVGTGYREDSQTYNVIMQAIDSDGCMWDTRQRIGMKPSGFQTYYVRPDDIVPTLRGHNDLVDIEEKARLSCNTVRNAQTFPEDYDFGENYGPAIVDYVCGMSVPPVMTKRIVQRLIDIGLYDYKLKH